jgi:hypothetical protein
MKKMLLISLLFVCVFTVGCEKEDREMKCTSKNGDTTINVTISEIEGKVTVKTENVVDSCVDELCSTSGTSEEKEADEDFDKLVEKYRKDGYTCE